MFASCMRDSACEGVGGRVNRLTASRENARKGFACVCVIIAPCIQVRLRSFEPEGRETM